MPSARNLAAHLALRRWDLPLMPRGLSSLGRIESRLEPTIDALMATLVPMVGNGGATEAVRRELLRG